jgi:hypothetical protein
MTWQICILEQILAFVTLFSLFSEAAQLGPPQPAGEQDPEDG